MTWKGSEPVVELLTTAYQTGVKLTKEAMDALETQLERLPHLELIRKLGFGPGLKRL